MLNATDHISGEAVQTTFEVVTTNFDSDQVFQGPLQIHVHQNADVFCDESPDVVDAHFDDLAETYERAIQALRDIRHMLPPEGVAIVDEVLVST